ncbi:SH3 domain-containing protein [Nonomuraea zeae]|uniref:SH3 domain-containing protein n=1 Tax=Nonomuraea zeae TaxID=1642303 RepID=A0A5S4G9X5_9ACTN|nr:SH3 domain-containing protein [Nonomuraea zeae]TMR29816.1 SH3 domain-containing protein [Nonomuraea zeae]
MIFARSPLRWRTVRAAAVTAVAAVLAGTIGAPPALAVGSGQVATDGRNLNVRSGPGTHYGFAAAPLANGTRVTVYCVRWGESIDGLYGRSSWWDKIDRYAEKYVADALVYTGTMEPVAPRCGKRVLRPLDERRAGARSSVG